MGRYKDDSVSGDLLGRIRDIEERLSRVERTPQLGNSAIDRGSVVVYSGQGNIVFYHHNGVQEMLRIGLFQSGFGPIDYFALKRLDDTPFVVVQTNLFGFEDWAWFDGVGNRIVSCAPTTDFTNFGVGLNRPYLAVPFFTAATPTDTTASGTFTTLQRGAWLKQHPYADFWVRYNVTATTGEIQFLVGSEIIGGPVTIPNGSGILYVSPFAMPGSHLDSYEVTAQARVASGAGNVAVQVLGYGREAP